MSKFSDYLKKLLDDRGEPISRIAKNTGLERTSIHKALKDERLLPYTALRRLSQYLQLTLAQSRELNLYYEILLQGEDIYRTRQAIGGLLSGLSQLHFTSRNLYVRQDTVPDPRPFPNLIYGRPQIESALQLLLDWETVSDKKASLDLYLPSNELGVTGLFGLWRTGRMFSARQLITFLPEHCGESSRQENIRLLTDLIPVSLVSGGQYAAYYYFEQAAARTTVDPMPYFIITPHYLVRLDEKLSIAQFETSIPVLELYRKRFGQMLEECQSLNSYSDNLEEILDSYMRATDVDCYYTIMTQPCLGHYYTRARIERHIRPGLPNREMIVEQSDRRFERLRSMQGEYYTIFTEEGLRQLAETGVAADLPPELVLPIDRTTRLEMMLAFRNDIAAGKLKGCIANVDQLPIPPYLTLTCDPKFGLHLYATQGFIEGAYSCNLHLEESGIGTAFSSFIRALPGSKYVYSTEKTLEILDELIDKLKKSVE